MLFVLGAILLTRSVSAIIFAGATEPPPLASLHMLCTFLKSVLGSWEKPRIGAQGEEDVMLSKGETLNTQ